MAIFTLGSGTDVIAGTAGNDEVRLRGHTLSNGDTLSGGDGTDTIRVLRADFGAIDFTKPGITVTGFERIVGSNLLVGLDSGNDVIIFNETVFSQFVDINGGTGSDELVFRGTSPSAVFDLTPVTLTNIETLDIQTGRLVLNAAAWSAIQAGTIALQGGPDGTVVIPGVVVPDNLTARTSSDVLDILLNGVFEGTVEFQVSVTTQSVTADATRTATLNDDGQYVETTTDPTGTGPGGWSYQTFTRTMDITDPNNPVLLETSALLDDGSLLVTTYSGGIRSEQVWTDLADAYIWDVKTTTYVDGVGTELIRATINDDGTGEISARVAGLVLEGRDGQTDTLFGFAGADTFVFGIGSGTDRIHAFEAALDTLDLSGSGIADYTALLAIASQGVGASTVLTLGGGDVLTIGGINLGTLEQIDLAGRILYDV